MQLLSHLKDNEPRYKPGYTKQARPRKIKQHAINDMICSTKETGIQLRQKHWLHARKQTRISLPGRLYLDG